MLYRQIILEWGQDTESGVWGLGYSPDNGKNFYVLNTTHGRKYRAEDGNRLYPYISDQIQDKIDTVVAPAKSAADSAVSAADAAVASAQVTSDAVSAIASATAEAKQGANDAMSRAKSAWDVATGAKAAVTDFDPLLKQAQSDAGKALTQIADTASALSDAKTAFSSDVAAAKNLANTAQTTADSAVKSASSVADDLTKVASQAKSNAEGITKVTSDVGLLQTTVADNSGNISKIQETATQIQQAVSDNSGNITVATQTAQSAVTVASNARSNATVATQTASQASVTAKNASGQAASAVLTANGAMTTASDAKSNATVAVQTASGASLTATNAKSDATVAKQTASEAKVQASNAESDFAQLSIRANKIEANVANNSGAIASVQQTANGLTTTVSGLKNQFTQTKQTIDGIATTINDPKTGLNATYQTAAGNATTISNVKSDVYQLQTTASGLTSRVGNLESKSATQQTEFDQTKAAILQLAKQTDVDTLKGNVTDLQAKSTTQADEIKNKVTRSDVTGMLTGYATQEYAQGLVTLKADQWNLNLTTLKTDVNAIKTNGGGRNLLNGTSDVWTTITAGGWMIVTTAKSDKTSVADYHPGDKFTYSATVTNKSDTNVRLEMYCCDINGTRLTGDSNHALSDAVAPNTYNKKVSCTIAIDGNTWFVQHTLIADGGTSTSKTVQIKGEMFEAGTIAHDWSPAPSDMATVTSVTNLSATVDGIKGLVETKASQSEVTQLSNLVQSKVSSGDFTSATTQLKNLINQRVQVGDVISQINQEAGGDTLIQVSNGKGSFVLNAANTIMTGKAWIPDAAISEINTDKLYFSDSSGNKSFMSTNLGALDPMAPANSLSIRYKTGYEVTTSDRGVFFMMGQNYTRYAVRSKYSDNFSGIWASDTEAFFIEEGQGLHLWATGKDQSAWALYNSNNVGIRASLATTNAIDVGKVDDGYAYNTKMDTSPTAMAFYINGWEWVAGYVEAMGHSQHSILSAKTRIEQADPDHMLDLINQTELTTFAYKSELADGTDHRHIGPIIDDINDVAQYQIPSEFVAPTRTARDDGNIVGALIGAVQALTKRIKTLEDKA
ncbi:tail fiber domain-containing protein [Limosilactobacillus fermentum]|uniref:tail fiber domain-containing protein n=1 Tax=Limosilactobacillus fermentum TaxID=1613 RepID=UPI003265B491